MDGSDRNGPDGRKGGERGVVSEADLIQIGRYFTVDNVTWIDFERPSLKAYWSRLGAPVIGHGRFQRSNTAESSAELRTNEGTPEV
jgi:hypothetical protein